MGTRHLIAVFYQGEYRIAQYGQWDGYPKGQGVGVLKFARDKLNRNVFLEKLLKLRWMTKEDAERIDKISNWQRQYPQLSRDAGSDVLEIVHDGEDGLILKNNINFAGESLFCEWAYVLDFDKNTFEVFRGFNKTPLDPSERFASSPLDHAEYKQVKFITSWPLDRLTSNEDFVRSFVEPDDDEEAAA